MPLNNTFSSRTNISSSLAALEITDLVAFYRTHYHPNNAALVVVGDVTLLGEQANEVALREALAQQDRWRAVHLACHGLVDRDRPMLSALALAADTITDSAWLEPVATSPAERGNPAARLGRSAQAVPVVAHRKETNRVQ